LSYLGRDERLFAVREDPRERTTPAAREQLVDLRASGGCSISTGRSTSEPVGTF
jgi:hypothetical protein